MYARVIKALSLLPAELASALKPIIEASDFDSTISPEQFECLLSTTHMTDTELRLALLPLAASYAVVPISNFYVGAIVRGTSGRLYFGANMEFENASMACTIHAEQSAISHAWIKGEVGIKDVTINYSPCGHCRQFMNELTSANDMMIQLPQREPMTLQQYLPDSFGPLDLGVKDGLLSDLNNGICIKEGSELAISACNAANRSHAPYSKNFSGVALKAHDGRVFEGMYAENAAFNPSLPPLQVALINMNMSNYSLSEIAEAALVESAESKISQLARTQALLEALNPDIQLTYVAY